MLEQRHALSEKAVGGTRPVERSPEPEPVAPEASPAALPASPSGAPPSIGVSRASVEPATPLRCPYCHASVVPGDESVASCEQCGAVHHDACWSESRSCASCRAPVSLESVRRRRRRRWLALLAWLGGPSVLAVTGVLVTGQRPGAVRATGRPSVVRHLGPRVEPGTLAPTQPPVVNSKPAVTAIDRPEQRLKAARWTGPIPGEGAPALRLAERAFELAEMGRIEESLVALESARQSAGNDALAWCRIGETDALVGDYRGATTTLERAVALDPWLSRAHAALAETLYRSNWNERADGEVVLALAASPVSPKAYTVRAERAVRANEVARALEDVEAALALDPSDVAAVALRAVVFARANQTYDARDDVRKLLGFVDSPANRELAGAIEAFLGNGDAAAMHLLEAARRTELSAPIQVFVSFESDRVVAEARSHAWLVCGDELAAKDSPLALEAYQRAARLAPEAHGLAADDAALHSALFHERTGDLEQAENDLDALAIGETFGFAQVGGFTSDVLRTRARVREKRGKLVGAIGDLEDLILYDEPAQKTEDTAKLEVLRRQLSVQKGR